MKYLKKIEVLNDFNGDVESLDGFEEGDIIKFKPGYIDYADNSSIRTNKPKVSEGIYKIRNFFIYKQTTNYASIVSIINNEEFDRSTSDMVLATDYEIDTIKYNL